VSRFAVSRWKFYLSLALAALLIFILLVFFLTPSFGDFSLPDYFGKLELAMAGGERLVLLDQGGYSDWIAIGEVPENILDIIIGVEDFRFKRHFGIDLRQIYYALMDNIRNFDFVYGASTITQQLARNVWLSQKKSLVRKLQEAILSVRLEERLTKQEILEWYINIIEMAPGIRGLRAGARYYFGKEPAELGFKEQLFLAAVLHAPSRYAAQAELAYPRMRALARNLFEQGKIPAFQADALSNAALSFTYTRPPAAPGGLRRAVQALWPRSLRRGANLLVETKIDRALQERLERLMLDLRASGEDVFVYAEGGRALVLASRQGAERMREYAPLLGYAGLSSSPRPDAERLRSELMMLSRETPIVFSEKKVLDAGHAIRLGNEPPSSNAPAKRTQ